MVYIKRTNVDKAEALQEAADALKHDGSLPSPLANWKHHLIVSALHQSVESLKQSTPIGQKADTDTEEAFKPDPEDIKHWINTLPPDERSIIAVLKGWLENNGPKAVNLMALSGEQRRHYAGARVDVLGMHHSPYYYLGEDKDDLPLFYSPFSNVEIFHIPEDLRATVNVMSDEPGLEVPAWDGEM